MQRPYLLSAGTTVVLSEPASAVLGENAPRQTIAEWQGPARPIEVALYAEIPGLNLQFPGRSQPGIAGNNNQFSPPVPAFFQLDYGCGSVARRRIVDAQSARLFLGVCDSVRITAGRWLGTTPWTFATQWSLITNGTIGEAVGGSYDELQSTSIIECETAVAIQESLTVPMGSYCWEAGVAAEGPGASNEYWGTAQPDIFFASDTEEVVYRAANYQVCPPFRRFKPPYAGTMYIHSGGAALIADLTVMVRWYLNS